MSQDQPSAHNRLGPRERLLFAVLLLAYPQPVTLQKFIDLIYGEDAEGGPLCAADCIETAMIPVRRIAKALDWSIANTGQRFQIVFENDEAPLRLFGREREIYEIIKGTPGITLDRLAAKLDGSQNTVSTQVCIIRKKLLKHGQEHIPYARRGEGFRLIAGKPGQTE